MSKNTRKSHSERIRRAHHFPPRVLLFAERWNHTHVSNTNTIKNTVYKPKCGQRSEASSSEGITHTCAAGNESLDCKRRSLVLASRRPIHILILPGSLDSCFSEFPRNRPIWEHVTKASIQFLSHSQHLNKKHLVFDWSNSAVQHTVQEMLRATPPTCSALDEMERVCRSSFVSDL